MSFQSRQPLHKRRFIHPIDGTVLQSIQRLTAMRIFKLVLLFVILISLTFTLFQSPAYAQAGWQWYKVDTHVHSSVSADAYVDIGIHSHDAIASGYDAIFLTDHNGGSSFQVNNLTANHMAFEDTYTRWEVGTYGSLSATTNALASTPIHTGTQSLHLKSSSNTSGETYVWAHRGPNFRSGDIMLKFSVYPTRIDPGSGLYVSVSIGGDPTVLNTPNGYTTTAGVVSPGKSTVLVWQLGSGRAPSSDPNARVLAYSLGSYTLNAWNTYDINISQALADIPVADRPLDYNGLIQLKMTAAANGGTVEGYFDTYSIDASTPVDPALEYVYRTGIVDDFNTSTFKVFPSYEMGQQRHTNRFNFGITNTSQYRSYTYGSDGIVETQQSGYPAQLNHPGTTITVQEAINGQGLGADFLEVREQAWIDAWDAILQQGVQILGNWSSDTHAGESAGRAATYIYAPALDFDKLVQSLYEGRTYDALNNFSGRVVLNLSNTSQDPYPARYPVYVSDAQANANVHMLVTAGLGSGYTMRWYRNGVLTATDNKTAASYDTTKSISLTGAFTYVRAEVKTSTGSIKGMTQPIFFRDVPGLPVDKTFHVDKVTTANGSGYNKLLTKGITASNWNAANNALSMTLENPVNALVDLLVTSNSAPQQVMVNGAAIAVSGTLTDFQAATNSAWYYDAPTSLLYLKVKHTATIANVVLGFNGNLPTPTSTPTNTPTNTPTFTATPTQAGQLFTFTSVADTYTNESKPTTNYGTATTLREDASPIQRGYLRFNVQSLSSPITRATLRVYANSTSTTGYTVSSLADNTWGELTLNYNNAPQAGGPIGSSGKFSTGTWTTVDVTPYITGTGTFSFVLTTSNSTVLNLASRESGINAPQLVVETQISPTLTPSNTPTASQTSIPTDTPTATPSPTWEFTPTPSDTPSVTPTPTDTLIPTDTFTPTATPIPSDTPTSTATFTSTPTAAVNTFTINPVADAYVNEASPTVNYGNATTLRADASPIVRSYLRFNVQGLSGRVTRVTLRVFTNSSSSTGYEVRNVADNSWGELTINYANAPAIDSVTATSGSFGTGAWTTVDITPLVAGNGTFNLALTTTNNTAFSLASRESGANAPQLIIETSP